MRVREKQRSRTVGMPEFGAACAAAWMKIKANRLPTSSCATLDCGLRAGDDAGTANSHECRTRRDCRCEAGVKAIAGSEAGRRG